jgi:hypothetical protein
MNDEHSILIVEGPHDQAAAERILGLFGYNPINHKERVSECFNRLIPTSYPFKEDYINLGDPTPRFRSKGCSHVAIITAGGDSQIVPAFYKIENIDVAHWENIKFIGVLLDSDSTPVSKRKSDLIKGIKRDKNLNFLDYSKLEDGYITAYGNRIRFDIYAFPDDRNTGSLEDVLIEGAVFRYPTLLTVAEDYIKNIPDPYKTELDKKNTGCKKALIGVMANVFKPGKANQISIQENDWFTRESIEAIDCHRLLYVFINNNIGLHN